MREQLGSGLEKQHLRIEYPGVVYHVTSRGNGRNMICLADGDQRLLEFYYSIVSGWQAKMKRRYGFSRPDPKC